MFWTFPALKICTRFLLARSGHIIRCTRRKATGHCMLCSFLGGMWLHKKGYTSPDPHYWSHSNVITLYTMSGYRYIDTHMLHIITTWQNWTNMAFIGDGLIWQLGQKCGKICLALHLFWFRLDSFCGASKKGAMFKIMGHGLTVREHGLTCNIVRQKLCKNVGIIICVK